MASILVMGTATMFMLDLSLGAYCYLLHGLQRIREEKTVAIIGYILEPIMIYVFLRSGFGVYSLLLAFILRYVWSLSAFIRLAYRFQPGLNISFRHFDKVMLRHFFGFGTAIQISTLIGTFLFSVDRLMAGFLLGPKGIALFELSAKLPLAAISVPSSISNVTMPAAAHHSAHDDMESIRSLFRKSSRAVSMISGLPLAFMALFSTPLAFAWLGDREGLSQMPLIMALTALWSQLHITTGPGSAVFRALGRAGNEFVYHGLRITALALGIGLALVLIKDSTTALITGLSIGSACAALIYLLHNQKQLGLKTSVLFRDILLPGLAAYPIAACVYLLWRVLLPSTLSQWHTLAAIAVAGLLYTSLWALMAWRMLDASERSVVHDILVRLRTRIPAWRNA
jgi:O-antigen/teichoic acid export membrane protein